MRNECCGEKKTEVDIGLVVPANCLQFCVRTQRNGTEVELDSIAANGRIVSIIYV